jgi:predicted Ser/Thr protein kinase
MQLPDSEPEALDDSEINIQTEYGHGSNLKKNWQQKQILLQHQLPIEESSILIVNNSIL